MTSPTNAYQPAIDELEKDIADLERQWNSLVSAVNVLRGKAGLPPRGPSGPGPGEAAPNSEAAKGSPQSIRPDQFYGKRMGAAAREYLQIRQAQGFGPAKPRDIFDALKSGGYQFGGKDETNQMVVLRTMLRKSTQMFHKLPNGTWGLKAWYGNVKTAKTGSKDQPTADQDGPNLSEREKTADNAKSSAA